MSGLLSRWFPRSGKQFCASCKHGHFNLGKGKVIPWIQYKMVVFSVKLSLRTVFFLNLLTKWFYLESEILVVLVGTREGVVCGKCNTCFYKGKKRHYFCLKSSNNYTLPWWQQWTDKVRALMALSIFNK